MVVKIEESVVTSLEEIQEAIKSCGTIAGCRMYRGQTRDWPLIPSLGRIFRGQLLPNAEQLLMERFWAGYSSRFQYMVKNDPNAAHFIVNLEDKNQWRQLAVAQHYGLPTRLLDWSQNLDVATYFAVRGAGEGDLSDGVLFVFYDKSHVLTENARIWPKLTIKNVRPYRAWRDTKVNRLPRLREQRGGFTIQPDPTEDAFSQLSEKAGHSAWKLRIPRIHKKRIRTELACFGITENHLFGDLDSLCREVTLDVFGRFA